MLDSLPTELRRRIDVCGDTGCWVWTGLWNSGNGYGKVRYEGRTWMVHRLVYTLLIGNILSDIVLDHRCRRRRCCNPTHVEPVTTCENTRRGDAILFKTAEDY